MSQHNRTARTVLIAAWAFPAMVIGQFAFLAGIPVAIVLIGTSRDARLHALRWPTAAIAAAYAIPLTFWLSTANTAPSLSKYMSPLVTGVVAAIGVVGAVAHHVHRSRSAARA